jgi:pantoate kinase
LGDLFELHFTLKEAADFAHVAEIQCVTGLGTVISLASGGGPVGLVTEPGSYSVGRTDVILADYEKYLIVCASFGPIEKSSILSNENARMRVNEFGRKTLDKILKDPTPEALLKHSREFSEKAGLGSRNLLKLSDKAVELGALGATPNMIGNAIHCLVLKSRRDHFVQGFLKLVPKKFIFESELARNGPFIE